MSNPKPDTTKTDRPPTVDEGLAIHELGHVIGALLNGASLAQAFPINSDTAMTQCLRIRIDATGVVRKDLNPSDMPVSYILAGPAFSLVYGLGAPIDDILKLGFASTAIVADEYGSDIEEVRRYMGNPAGEDDIAFVHGSFRGMALLAHWMKQTDALRPLIDEFVAHQRIAVPSNVAAEVLGERYLNIVGLGLVPGLMQSEDGRRSVIAAVSDPRQYPAPDFGGHMDDITKLRQMPPLQTITEDAASRVMS